jgi:DNA repair photolyase
MMKKRCGVVKTYEEWCRPKIVSNALELLEKEIPRYKDKINYVHLCFSTDPFMYNQDEVRGLSLKIIDMLNENRIRCTVLTKGVYPRELANRNGFGKNNKYGITIVSLDENFRREYEPNSAELKKRIDSLRYLHDRGFKTWISMEPYPTPNIIRQDLTRILDAVSFVNRIIFGRLNYNVKSSEFKYTRQFYNDLSSAVISFCRKNRIEYHIKEGTRSINRVEPTLVLR